MKARTLPGEVNLYQEYRRDSKPRSSVQAEIRLTTLCIERWGASALLPLPSVLTTLASQSVKYITAHLRTG